MAPLIAATCYQWWSRFRRTCLHQVSWILNSLMLMWMKYFYRCLITCAHIRTNKCRPYAQTELDMRRKCGLICTNISIGPYYVWSNHKAVSRQHQSPCSNPAILPNSVSPAGILLADPGRNGMPKAFRRQLLELQVPKLLYISSGRAFLRDVAYLTTKRGYRLKDA